MRRVRKFALITGGLILGYLVLLVFLGLVLTGVVEDRVRDRLAYALRADKVSIEDVELSLLRGVIEVRGVRAKRTTLGTASLEIGRIDIDVAAMGLALFDSDPDQVLVEDAHLELSAVGAATLRKGKSSPLHIGKLHVKDSSVKLVATGLLPSIGHATVEVQDALARDIRLSNSMSWLHATERLDASVHATGDVRFGLRYGEGTIVVSGSFLGSKPIEIPFQWPEMDPELTEIRQILRVSKALLKALAPELARREVHGVWDDIIEIFD